MRKGPRARAAAALRGRADVQCTRLSDDEAFKRALDASRVETVAASAGVIVPEAKATETSVAAITIILQAALIAMNGFAMFLLVANTMRA